MLESFSSISMNDCSISDYSATSSASVVRAAVKTELCTICGAWELLLQVPSSVSQASIAGSQEGAIFYQNLRYPNYLTVSGCTIADVAVNAATHVVRSHA